MYPVSIFIYELNSVHFKEVLLKPFYFYCNDNAFLHDLLQKQKEKSQDLKTRPTESKFEKLLETNVVSTVKIESRRMIMKSHMQQIDIDVGDDVIGLEFGSRDSTMIIQRILDAEKLENVGILLKKCTKKISEEPKIGQMIACKWSEDDKIYRAEVISVFGNKDETKVKVLFVDYGNEAIETLENILEFPTEASTIPILSSIVTLDNLKATNILDLASKNGKQSEELEKLLDSELKVVGKDGVPSQSRGSVAVERQWCGC